MFSHPNVLCMCHLMYRMYCHLIVRMYRMCYLSPTVQSVLYLYVQNVLSVTCCTECTILVRMYVQDVFCHLLYRMY